MIRSKRLLAVCTLVLARLQCVNTAAHVASINAATVARKLGLIGDVDCASELFVDYDIGLQHSQYATINCGDDWTCCCQACAKSAPHNMCTHWVYHYAGAGHCYLKNSIASNPAVRVPLVGFLAGTVAVANDIDRNNKGYSCRERCGRQVGDCFCDKSCQHYGDCCADFATHCTVTEDDMSTVDHAKQRYFRECIQEHGSDFPSYCRYMSEIVVEHPNRTIVLIQNSAISSFPVAGYGGVERAIEVIAEQLHEMGVPLMVIIPGRKSGAVRGTYPFPVIEMENAPGLDALPPSAEGHTKMHQMYFANLKFAEEVLRFLAVHPLRDDFFIWSQEAWSAHLASLGRPQVSNDVTRQLSLCIVASPAGMLCWQVITTYASLGAQTWFAPEIYGGCTHFLVCGQAGLVSVIG